MDKQVGFWKRSAAPDTWCKKGSGNDWCCLVSSRTICRSPGWESVYSTSCKTDAECRMWQLNQPKNNQRNSLHAILMLHDYAQTRKSQWSQGAEEKFRRALQQWIIIPTENNRITRKRNLDADSGGRSCSGRNWWSRGGNCSTSLMCPSIFTINRVDRLQPWKSPKCYFHYKTAGAICKLMLATKVFAIYWSNPSQVFKTGEEILFGCLELQSVFSSGEGNLKFFSLRTHSLQNRLPSGGEELVTSELWGLEKSRLCKINVHFKNVQSALYPSIHPSIAGSHLSW